MTDLVVFDHGRAHYVRELQSSPPSPISRFIDRCIAGAFSVYDRLIRWTADRLIDSGG